MVYSNKPFSFSMKLMNLMQKYAHITELSSCILQISAVVFLLPIFFLISFGICLTPKLSKYFTLTPFRCNFIQ